MSALFLMTIFERFFQNQSESVKSGDSKICHIFRSEHGRALSFVVNYIYKIALVISLGFRASGKIEKIGKIM